MIIVPIFPTANEDLLPVDTEVVFDLEDLVNGVNLATLNVTIAGSPAYASGSFQAGFTGSILADPQQIAGRRYRVVISKTVPYAVSVVAVVAVSVSSLTAVPASLSWSFRPSVARINTLNTASDVVIVNPGVGGIRWIFYVQGSTVYARKEVANVLSAETAVAPGYLIDAGYNVDTGEIVVLFEHNGLVFVSFADFITDSPSLLTFSVEQLFGFFRMGTGGESRQLINDPYTAFGDRSDGATTALDHTAKPSAMQVLEDGDSMTTIATIPTPPADAKRWQAIEFYAMAPGGTTKIGEMPFVPGTTVYALTVSYGGSAFRFMRHGAAIRYSDTTSSYIVSVSPQLGRQDFMITGFGGNQAPLDVDTPLSAKVSFTPIQFPVVEGLTFLLGFGGNQAPLDVDTPLSAKVSFTPIQFPVVEPTTFAVGWLGDESRLSDVTKDGFGTIQT